MIDIFNGLLMKYGTLVVSTNSECVCVCLSVWVGMCVGVCVCARMRACVCAYHYNQEYIREGECPTAL